MNYRAIAIFGVFVILLATMVLISPYSVFADSYEKSQVVSQIKVNVAITGFQ